jgi:hypothetical protein
MFPVDDIDVICQLAFAGKSLLTVTTLPIGLWPDV